MAAPKSRERILDAARELFVTEGYEHTTVSRIRTESGVSNGTLFHHFPTKEAILDALYTEAMKRLNRRFFAALEGPPPSLRELLRGLVDAILAFAVAEPDGARITYYLGPLSAESPSREELEKESAAVLIAVKANLQPFRDSGELKSVPDTALMSIIQGPAHLIAKYWLADPDQFPAPTNLLDVFTDAALAGLTGNPEGESVPARPSTGQIEVSLVDQDGRPIGSGRTTIDLNID